MMKNRFLAAALVCTLSLVPRLQAEQADGFRFEEQDDRQLSLFEGERPLLTYRYGVVVHENVPDSDLRRNAGCYVHPLFGLDGEVLTDNAPRDHYHHHGAFWTWPHVGVHQADGTVRHYDLWTSDTDLKQHFVRWHRKTTLPDGALVDVENGWFVGKPEDGDKIMTERVRIVAHRIQTSADGFRSRAVDFDFTWKPTDKAVSLRGSEGKSYGGFSVRFKPFISEETLKKNPRAEAQKNDSNVITVSDGERVYGADTDLPETPLAWADYTSKFGGQNKQSGATIFVPRSHPDFAPTWLTRYYGALCVGWPGVDGKKFEPGEEIHLSYRIWIHDGRVTAEQINAAYEVLKEAGEPMNIKQIMEKINERGLAKLAGKTPAATVSAALQREISTKQEASRFEKAGKGLFRAK